jgi:hypothetical protein
MIMSYKNRATIQAASLFLALGAFAAAGSAQPAAEKNPAAKTQGQATDAAATQPAAAPSATSAPPALPAKIDTTAAKGTAAAATNTPAPAPFPVKNGYSIVDFDRLASFEFDPPSSDATNQAGKADPAETLIPADIKALDNKKVMLRGFMMPVTMEEDKTTEFFITRNPMCCAFGVPTKMNELVTVKVGGKGLEPNMGQPVTIKGTLHVGAIRDAGDVTGLYRMDGEALVDE